MPANVHSLSAADRERSQKSKQTATRKLTVKFISTQERPICTSCVAQQQFLSVTASFDVSREPSAHRRKGANRSVNGWAFARVTTDWVDATLWKSRTSFPPECGWRNTNKFSKYTVQLRCIAEPHRARYLAKRKIGFGQQSSRSADPLRQDVLVGRKPNRVLECPDEVVVAQSRQGR